MYAPATASRTIPECLCDHLAHFDFLFASARSISSAAHFLQYLTGGLFLCDLKRGVFIRNGELEYTGSTA